MTNKNNKKKEFMVYWTESHQGIIQASNFKAAKRKAENGLDGVKEHPRHIVVDNIYVEK